MLGHTDLKKGLVIIVDGQPYEILEATPQRYAQRKLMIQTKLRSPITGNVMSKTVHQGDVYEEAQINRMKAKFLYSNRGRFFFCEEQDPSKRFDLGQDQIGDKGKYFKPNAILDALVFEGKIINISLPVKVQLKVIEAAPGVKGDSAQGATKSVTLETGAQIQSPLFVDQGDIIEINTETGEYVRRVEQ